MQPIIRGTFKKQPPISPDPLKISQTAKKVAESTAKELELHKERVNLILEKKGEELDNTATLLEERTTEAITEISGLKEQVAEATNNLKDGEQGIQGVKGDKGDKGEKGDKGDTGEKGEAGQDAKPIDEKKLKLSILKSLPQKKGDLKIIQEKVEIDPMSVIEKIMELPADKFKLKLDQIDGLDQTISAFRSQLSRGYLHGGGDTLVAGTNITLTKNSDGTKTIASTDIDAIWGNITGTITDQTDLTTYLTGNFLNLNQTTPQTTVGTFTFPQIIDSGLTASSLVMSDGSKQLISIANNSTSTEKFLSQTSSGTPSWQTIPSAGSLTYYFQNTNSDITNPSQYLSQITTPYSSKTTKNFAGVNTTRVLINFATSIGFPNLGFIPAGQFEFHIHADTTNPGSVDLYAEFWEVSVSAGTETDVGLIGTTETTNGAMSGSEKEFRLYFVTANTYTMTSVNNRIVCRIWALRTSSSHDIKLYIGGTADSHISLPSNTVDATNFVPYTGAVSDVDLGTHNITTTGVGTFGKTIINQVNDTEGLTVNGFTSPTDNFKLLLNSSGWGTFSTSKTMQFTTTTGPIGFYTTDGSQTYFNSPTRVNDNFLAQYGTGSNWGLGYNTGTSTLQLVTGFTIGSNVKLDISATTFDFKAGNLTTTGTVTVGTGDTQFRLTTISGEPGILALGATDTSISIGNTYGYMRIVNINGDTATYMQGSRDNYIFSKAGGGLLTQCSFNATRLRPEGFIYMPNYPQTNILMNSAGSYFGTIQNDSADKWSLGYSSTFTNAVGTSVLQWSPTLVTVSTPLTVNGTFTKVGTNSTVTIEPWFAGIDQLKATNTVLGNWVTFKAGNNFRGWIDSSAGFQLYQNGVNFSEWNDDATEREGMNMYDRKCFSFGNTELTRAQMAYVPDEQAFVINAAVKYGPNINGHFGQLTSGRWLTLHLPTYNAAWDATPSVGPPPVIPLPPVSALIAEMNGTLKLGLKLGILEGGSTPTAYTYLQSGNLSHADKTFTLPITYPVSADFPLISSTGGIMAWNDQAVKTTSTVQFNTVWFQNSSTTITKDGGGNMIFTDAVAGSVSLTTLMAGGAGEIPGVIKLWSGSVASIPAGYILCNGGGGSPNLTDSFVRGAGNTFNPNDTGGSATASTSNAGSHDHIENGSFGGGTTYNVVDGGGDSVLGSDNTLSLGTTGSVGDHNHGSVDTIPPFYALAYIIKT